jgi:glycerol-1-phosphate dehydrogenase [NAD(P)+]
MTSDCSSEVIIAREAIEKLDDILEGYGKPICVTDTLLYEKYNQLVSSIVGEKLEWLIIGDGITTNTKNMADADIILGFGGGRSIDQAKIMARNSHIEWISIPTAASHDGIASEVASVMHNGYRYSEKCKRPKLILADLDIMDDAPPHLRLSGLGDIISKASSLAEWRLARDYADEKYDSDVYATVEAALEAVLSNTSLEVLVRSVIDAGIAMSEFGSSRPCSGTEHAISHAMDRRNHNLHGLQVAFATPFSLHFLRRTDYGKYPPLEILQFMKKEGMPVTFDEMDLTAELFLDDIDHAIRIMNKRNRYSVLKHVHAEHEDILLAIEKIGY